MKTTPTETEMSFLSDDEQEKICYDKFMKNQKDKAFLLEQLNQDLNELLHNENGISELDLSATIDSENRLETYDSDNPQSNQAVLVICRKWNTQKGIMNNVRKGQR